jgi:hypothetical protein
MNDVQPIRGTVCGMAYEATFHSAEWPVVTGREQEWRITADGIPTFSITATEGLVSEQKARLVIELELERRLTAD